MVSVGALARDLRPVSSHFRAAMAAESPRAAHDGQTYSYEELIDFYGQERGEAKWAEAAPAVDDTYAIVLFAAAPARSPAQLRVGPPKHGYVYARTDKMHFGEPIYMHFGSVAAPFASDRPKIFSMLHLSGGSFSHLDMFFLHHPFLHRSCFTFVAAFWLESRGLNENSRLERTTVACCHDSPRGTTGAGAACLRATWRTSRPL